MSLMNLLILVIIAVALSIPGIFLVLRNMAMISDALSHTILLGIVLGYMLVRDLHSPLMIITAALTGIATVYFIEVLTAKKLIKSDAATGVVFPLFFSLGVIILSIYLRNVHLDLDCVIMGDITFADLDLISILGVKLPWAIFYGVIVLLINLTFTTVFFKELKLASFDPEAFTLTGFSNTVINYGLVTLVSLSSVVSFNIVGAILVIAFLVIPASTALLVTKHLHHTVYLTVTIAIVNSIIGYLLSIKLNVNSAGMCSALSGLVFLMTLAGKKLLRQSKNRSRSKIRA